MNALLLLPFMFWVPQKEPVYIMYNEDGAIIRAQIERDWIKVDDPAARELHLRFNQLKIYWEFIFIDHYSLKSNGQNMIRIGNWIYWEKIPRRVYKIETLPIQYLEWIMEVKNYDKHVRWSTASYRARCEIISFKEIANNNWESYYYPVYNKPPTPEFPLKIFSMEPVTYLFLRE